MCALFCDVCCLCRVSAVVVVMNVVVVSSSLCRHSVVLCRLSLSPSRRGGARLPLDAELATRRGARLTFAHQVADVQVQPAK